VLAGGRSARLGFPKALLRLGSGGTLLADTIEKLSRVASEVLVVGNEPWCRDAAGRHVPDDAPERASIYGARAALRSCDAERILIVGCDMPLLSASLLVHLAGREGQVAIPRVGGRLQPLCALYTRHCLGPIERAIGRGDLRMVAFHAEVDVRVVEEDEVRLWDRDARSFRNCNTPAALREIVALVEREGPDILKR